MCLNRLNLSRIDLYLFQGIIEKDVDRVVYVYQNPFNQVVGDAKIHHYRIIVGVRDIGVLVSLGKGVDDIILRTRSFLTNFSEEDFPSISLLCLEKVATRGGSSEYDINDIYV